MPGTSFDRVAEIYDDTRGGERRGDHFADDLAPWILGPRVVELGVGTGVIARGLRRHGFDVVGVDLSAAMMRRAVDRLGARVAVADVDELPLADASVDTAYFVWVLQLVADPIVTLTEAARVVRPGGRVIAILSNGEYAPDDEIAPIFERLAALRAERMGRTQLLDADVRGLRLDHQGFTGWDEFPSTVSEQIEGIEHRIYSSMFDVDDATWTSVVEPVLQRLRALPEPDRPRMRRNRHPLVVWNVTGGPDTGA
ncbi:MAG TPA: class I SAM-dependent methyltransferase [Ilumatobacteraceae bacterium]|nr:class I SAM-dependent methyltransferase [Ilumatobacteraceae bacterium]